MCSSSNPLSRMPTTITSRPCCHSGRQKRNSRKRWAKSKDKDMNTLNSVRRIFLMGAVSLLGLSLAACNEAKSEAKALLPVRLAPVETITVGNGVRYSADIAPYTQVDLAFKSNGYVDSVLQVK